MLLLGLSDELTQDKTQRFAAFMALIDSTPELSRYAQQMWVRHEHALAATIRKELKNKPSAIETEALARYVLDSYHRAFAAPRPKAALKALFKIVEQGWMT